MSERMIEVEITGGRSYDPDTGKSYALVAPGTRTEALLRLAGAALEYLGSGFWSASVSLPDAIKNGEAARRKMEAAADRLRAFDQGEGKDGNL